MLRSLLLRVSPRLYCRKMSSSASTMTSPFTKAVVSSMRKLYPEALADKSFDNTGLLLEAPFNPSRRQKNSVLLTIDLTKAVTEEAVQKKCSVVIAYHPIIFRSLKSLTFADSQQSSLLRLASEGISVYCPHTAVDTVPGGMADWLCDIVAGKLQDPGSEAPTATARDRAPLSNPTPTIQGVYSAQDPYHPPLPHTRSVIHSSPTPSLDLANAHTNSTIYTATNTGAGRLVTFTAPQPLGSLITRIGFSIGSQVGFHIATPQGTDVGGLTIRTCAICPGSGSHVFSGSDADLLFTGELSHHEALAAIERGGCVITLFHSNSERGYLYGVMKRRLEEELRVQWEMVRAGAELDDGVKAVVTDDEVQVWVSEQDRDPFMLASKNHLEEKKG